MTLIKRNESEITMSELKREYDNGTNLIQYICAATGSSEISAQAILKSYEIQAGSYISSLAEPGVHEFLQERALDIVSNLQGVDLIPLWKRAVDKLPLWSTCLKRFSAALFELLVLISHGHAQSLPSLTRPATESKGIFLWAK